jgi:hypothetical protein
MIFYLVSNYYILLQKAWLDCPVVNKVQILQRVLIYTTILPTGCEERGYEELLFGFVFPYFKHFNNFNCLVLMAYVAQEFLN